MENEKKAQFRMKVSTVKMFKLFQIRILIALLLCSEQAHSNNFEHLNSPPNGLRSFIEAKRQFMNSHNFKSQFKRNEVNSFENDNFLAQENEFVTKGISDKISVQSLLAKINEMIIISLLEKQNEQNENIKSNLKQIIKNQNNLELSIQSYTEAMKSNFKSSTDHLRIHDENLNCLQNCTLIVSEDGSCSQAKQDGAYVLEIVSNRQLQPFYAYCRREDDDKIWTVIQRREDGSINFNRVWYDYKHGFGDVYGEYWIGLERLHALTYSRNYELQIYLEDFENVKKIAKYSIFSIASENEGYRLNIGAYSGDAGDALRWQNNSKFTTYDQTNNIGRRNCAQGFKGGWWYRECYHCNLNGVYFSMSDKSTFGGIEWILWKFESLRRVIMAIRPL